LEWFGLPKGFSAREYLKVSAAMNAASYAFLGIVLAGLIYLPTMGKEDRALAKAVSGKLVIASIYGLDTVDLKTGRLTQSRRSRVPVPSPGTLMLTKEGDLYALGDDREAFRPTRYIRFGDAWRRGGARLPLWTDYPIGISPDANLLLYAEKKTSLVTNRTENRIEYTLPAGIGWGRFSYDNHFLLAGRTRYADYKLINLEIGKATALTKTRAGSFDFNPVGPELAWIDWDDDIIIYDCLTGKKRKLSVPGEIAMSSSVAWSPDGKYLAYLGGANPFTWQRFTPDLRVVEVAGGKSATVYRGLWTAGGSARLFWLP